MYINHMHWNQSVSTSNFSLSRHSQNVPKKTWTICLGPEFHVPFHLVKNQVEVFRCEAHISLLGMVISGWATISVLESSWGGASKICLALRKRRDCTLASIFWLSLCFSLYAFFLTISFSLSIFTLFFSLAYLPLPPSSFCSFLSLSFLLFIFLKNNSASMENKK